MITAVRIHNFKAFKDSGAVTLAPLTCLVGRNSSGKSSLLHGLLLFRQTLEESFTDTTSVPRLITNGLIYEGGTYRDLVFNHNGAASIGFEFSFRLDPEARADLGVSFLKPRRYGLPLYYRGFPPEIKQPASGHLKFTFSPQEPFGAGLTRFTIAIDDLGQLSCVRTHGDVRNPHWRTYSTEIPARSVEVSFQGGALLPRIRIRDAIYKRVGPHPKRKIQRFQAIARFGFQSLFEFAAGLHVLGPFRTPPSREYRLKGSGAQDVGPTGDRATDLLITEALLKPEEQRPLRQQVSAWLKRLGLARGIESKDIARRANLFELILERAGIAAHANFADVGFGVSQVLPVLVQGLVTPPGATYIVQQPELHLHPDAQAALADFFIDLTRRSVRSIVETHSEYFLVRLRRRLAERASGGRPEEELRRSAVAVFYTKETRTAGSSFVQLEIGDSFQFEGLPKGFMGQSVEDRLALMKALRR